MGKDYAQGIKKEYMAKYYAEKTTRVVMQLNNTTDADVIQRLNEVPNKQGYIKALIRADINK